MTEKWETIINCLSVVKSECVNMEKIRMMLDYDQTADEQVIDNLYVLKLIPLDEYKKRMEKRLGHLKEVLNETERRLEYAIEKGDDFNPIIFYACAFPYRGTAIENELNEDFMMRQKDTK